MQARRSFGPWGFPLGVVVGAALATSGALVFSMSAGEPTTTLVVADLRPICRLPSVEVAAVGPPTRERGRRLKGGARVPVISVLAEGCLADGRGCAPGE